MEEKKLNLKTFDLEAAKAGKPVYTRGGHKARIICFDMICPNSQGKNYPIVALITGDNGAEEIAVYDSNGKPLRRFYDIYELMTLPEKHEGWINIYKERCHDSKEEAISCRACNMECIDTIKVEWEE